MASTTVQLDTLTPVPPAPALRRESLQAGRLSQSASSGEHLHDNSEDARTAPDLNKGYAFGVIVSVALITGLGSFNAGLLTTELPAMAADVKLEDQLLLWPASINALVCGCTLLLCGSISDVVGGKSMLMAGCFLQSMFTLATGLAKTGSQVIAFRAVSGLAMSFGLPSSVSIITHSFASGKRRNVAFAAMGGSQPIGFSLGLVLGGIFASTVGWRWGFYISAILNIILVVIAAWVIPQDHSQSFEWKKLKTNVDWMGIAIISSALAMLSYALATVAIDAQRIKSASTLTLLITSLVLFPSFIFWMSHRERTKAPALIPNSLWRNRLFTSMCICVFLIWGTFNATEQFINFFFQYAQKLSPVQTSVRFLPEPIAGTATNIVVGMLAHRVAADHIVNVGALATLLSSLLMALANPKQTYWALAFPATLLNPVGCDCLFTVASLLITSLFPSHTQALAGGVFQTVAQVGKSVGLATSAVLASNVNGHHADSGSDDATSAAMLLDGYRAAFWYCFAVGVAALVVGAFGLRRIGPVGLKRD